MSTENNVLPELKQIVGALVFASRHPLRAGEIRKALVLAAQTETWAAPFAAVKEADIAATIEQIVVETLQARLGFQLVETADGFRLQSDGACGLWVRALLNADKPRHLSRPALETLAIVAYRQPITRVEIESIRGVNIDHILTALMEMQLVRMVGRSPLPGRPMLYGTTRAFLEHFGLQNLTHLPGVEELARRDAQAAAAAAAKSAAPEPAAAEGREPAADEPERAPAAEPRGNADAGEDDERPADAPAAGADPDGEDEEEEEFDDEEEDDEEEDDEEEEEDEEEDDSESDARRET